MRSYYECDEEMKIPKRYLKWSVKKIDRVLRRKAFFARIRNRFIPSENKLDFGYKINL